MAKKRTVSRRPRQQHTLLTRNELAAYSQGLPKSRHSHPFAPDRVPAGFHTIIETSILLSPGGTCRRRQGCLHFE